MSNWCTRSNPIVDGHEIILIIIIGRSCAVKKRLQTPRERWTNVYTTVHMMMYFYLRVWSEWKASILTCIHLYICMRTLYISHREKMMNMHFQKRCCECKRKVWKIKILFCLRMFHKIKPDKKPLQYKESTLDRRWKCYIHTIHTAHTEQATEKERKKEENESGLHIFHLTFFLEQQWNIKCV